MPQFTIRSLKGLHVIAQHTDKVSVVVALRAIESANGGDSLDGYIVYCPSGEQFDGYDFIANCEKEWRG